MSSIHSIVKIHLIFFFFSENRGAFCYDIVLDEKLKDWQPSEKDLIYFTKVARSIISKNLKFERLEVTPQTAFHIFADDRFVITMNSAIFHVVVTAL